MTSTSKILSVKVHEHKASSPALSTEKMEEEPFLYGVRCQNSNSCALKTVPGIVFVNLKLHLVEIFTFLKYLLSLKYKRSLFSNFFYIKMNVQGSQVSLR